MVIARLAGTRSRRVGASRHRTAPVGCSLGGIALAPDAVDVTCLIGFALVGAGCAAIVPAALPLRGVVPGVSHGAGIAAVATLGYAGGW